MVRLSAEGWLGSEPLPRRTDPEVAIVVGEDFHVRKWCGSWKDAIALREACERLGAVTAIVTRSAAELRGCDITIVHGSASVRGYRPTGTAQHVLRSLNVEPLQALDRLVAGRAPTYLRQIAVSVRDDARTAANRIPVLSISRHELATYWWFHRGAVYCPYVPPRLLTEEAGAERLGERVLLTMPAGSDAIAHSQIDGAVTLHQTLQRLGRAGEWQLRISSGVGSSIRADRQDLAVSALPLGSGTPAALIRGADAICLLGNAGRGCRTTVVDALVLGVHALVHPRLHRRLDPWARSLAVPTDPSSPASVEFALDRISRRLTVPQGALAELRAVQEQALRHVLGPLVA